MDKITENIVTTLNKNGGILETYFGTSKKKQKDNLKKMIMAEMVTQYPDLGSNSEFQGAITFDRYKADGTKKENMTYIPLGSETDTGTSTLYGLINGKNSNVLNYYSLDTEWNLVVATYTETISKTKTGEYSTTYVSNEPTQNYLGNDAANLNRGNCNRDKRIQDKENKL